MYKIKSNQPTILFNKNQQRGETLIEAMIAIFVLSFGVLVLMLAQLNSVDASINAANQATVTRAAQNYIEVIRANAAYRILQNQDTEGNYILVLDRNYTSLNANNTACIAALGLGSGLNNTKVTNCTIVNGVITVGWSDSTSGGTGFTYRISAI